MNEIEKIYKETTLCTLEKFQFIEETLKLIIITSYEIAGNLCAAYLKIRIGENEILKQPFGTLIREFKRISSDNELIGELEKITKERNEVAHKSMLFTLGELEDEGYLDSAESEMRSVLQKASSIHERLLDIRFELLRKKNVLNRQGNV